MRQSQLFSKSDTLYASSRLNAPSGSGMTNETKNTSLAPKFSQTDRWQLTKVVSSSAPGPPRVPKPVYSATDEHSATYRQTGLNLL